MVRPSKKKQIPNLQEAIKETAWKQIAQTGAATLSLRSIARELGITAPAIYNYFPSRDELVTALIVDAYKSLGDTQIRSIERLPEDDHALRFRTLGLSYRNWALTNPEHYNLIFGNPIPGYHAPMEITGPAAAESMIVLIQTLDTAFQDDALIVKKLPQPLQEFVTPWVDRFEYRGHPAVVHYALSAWAQIHGLVSLESFDHFSDAQALFEEEIGAMTSRLFRS